jgi:hypothetical protein
MGNRPVSPESATEWLLKLIVWEFFCTFTWSARARSCARKRRTHVTRWLRYWARTVRPAVADPLGQLAFVIRWERVRVKVIRYQTTRGLEVSQVVDYSCRRPFLRLRAGVVCSGAAVASNFLNRWGLFSEPRPGSEFIRS